MVIWVDIDLTRSYVVTISYIIKVELNRKRVYTNKKMERKFSRDYLMFESVIEIILARRFKFGPILGIIKA